MTDDDQALLSWLTATVADLTQQLDALARRVRDLEIQMEAELPALEADPRHAT